LRRRPRHHGVRSRLHPRRVATRDFPRSGIRAGEGSARRVGPPPARPAFIAPRTRRRGQPTGSASRPSATWICRGMPSGRTAPGRIRARPPGMKSACSRPLDSRRQPEPAGCHRQLRPGLNHGTQQTHGEPAPSGR
jgi:hypothetical protein